MYQEISKRDSLSVLNTILLIGIALALIIVFNIISSLINISSTLTDILSLILPVIFTFYIIKKYIVAYKYTIISDDFIIQEMIGSKEKILINININQIIKFTIADKKDNEQYFSKRKMYNGVNKDNLYNIVFKEDDRKKLVIIQPSDKLINLLEEKMK